MPTSHFFDSGIDEEHGDHAAGAGRQRGVGRDPADALQSMADSVEPGLKPYQPNHRITAPIAAMLRSCGGSGAAAVPLELAPEARAERDGAGQGDDAADGVHDGRAGEVTEHDAVGHDAVEPAHGVAEPAARTPDPVAEDRVDEARHAGAVEDVALEARAADHGARRDRRGGVGEGELEQEEGVGTPRRRCRRSRRGVVPCRKK